MGVCSGNYTGKRINVPYANYRKNGMGCTEGNASKTASDLYNHFKTKRNRDGSVKQKKKYGGCHQYDAAYTCWNACLVKAWHSQ
jgi:hypothetical protein